LSDVVAYIYYSNLSIAALLTSDELRAISKEAQSAAAASFLRESNLKMTQMQSALFI